MGLLSLNDRGLGGFLCREGLLGGSVGEGEGDFTLSANLSTFGVPATLLEVNGDGTFSLKLNFFGPTTIRIESSRVDCTLSE